jgi:hypothetical protein
MPDSASGFAQSMLDKKTTLRNTLLVVAIRMLPDPDALMTSDENSSRRRAR